MRTAARGWATESWWIRSSSIALLVLTVSSGLLAVLGAPTAGASPPPTGMLTATHPSARWSGAMVYDAKDGYSLLFGGGNRSALLNDTWAFRNGTWTQLFPPVSPPVRGSASIAYDPVAGYVLLFGGNNPVTTFGDTWKFSGGNWTPLGLHYGPSARFGASMVYDARDHYFVLFGGNDPAGKLLNDTWIFVHGHWKHVHPAVSPPPRRAAGMAYDASDGYVVLFGGLSFGDANDTWTYFRGNWTHVNATVAPGVRVAPSMVYDKALGEIVLFGGRDDNSQTLWGDTWTFHAGNWTQLAPAHSPSGRDGASAAFDTRAHRIVMFGGASTPYAPVSVDSGTWLFNGLNWRR
ncbi:MAG TPA: kelch repeat-containing protein [Thermoplasmata archaeon]|nr:kelch repeat-containing protein [Thermoplasmata archaeon]